MKEMAKHNRSFTILLGQLALSRLTLPQPFEKTKLPCVLWLTIQSEMNYY